MISLGVEHPDCNHIAGFNPMKDFVVEAVRLHPPESAVIKRLAFGRNFKLMKRLTDFVKELTAQIWPSRFMQEDPRFERQLVQNDAYYGSRQCDREIRRWRQSRNPHMSSCGF
jgi:hypothetical protein